MSQTTHRTKAAVEVLACVQQIQQDRASASIISDDEEEKNEMQVAYEKDLAKNRNLRVALTARGPVHEDAEYSAGEFTDDKGELAYRNKVLNQNIKKDYRRRLKWAAKDQRRHGGQIKLWTFEQNKKKEKMIMDKNAKATDATKEKIEKVEKVKKVKKAEKKAPKKIEKKGKKIEKKVKKEKKDRKSRGSALAEGKIKLLAKENPKRQGSKAWKRFELYKKHHTVAAYLEAGGKQSSLRYDEKHEHIKITDKKTKAELKEK